MVRAGYCHLGRISQYCAWEKSSVSWAIRITLLIPSSTDLSPRESQWTSLKGIRMTPSWYSSSLKNRMLQCLSNYNLEILVARCRRSSNPCLLAAKIATHQYVVYLVKCDLCNSGCVGYIKTALRGTVKRRHLFISIIPKTPLFQTISLNASI